MHLTSQVKLIILSVSLAIFSGGFLCFAEQREVRLAKNSNFSVAYFLNPKDDSLDFAVENNYSSPMEYRYEIKEENGTVKKKDSFVLASQEKKEIKISEIKKGEIEIKNQKETLLIKKN
jgi:flagellar assembly factor FliW